MGKAELLVIKRDYGTPCVYMPWLTFKGLCDAIEEHRAETERLKRHICELETEADV